MGQRWGAWLQHESGASGCKGGTGVQKRRSKYGDSAEVASAVQMQRGYGGYTSCDLSSCLSREAIREEYKW